MGTQGSQHSETSAKLQSSFISVPDFLYNCKKLCDQALLNFHICKNNSKDGGESEVSFKNETVLPERLAKVTYGHGGRVKGAVPHISMSAIATSIHCMRSIINSLLYADLLMPASAIMNKSSLCTEENSRAL